MLRNILALSIGFAFMAIGIDHFIHPVWYEPIVPEVLPSARFWVLFSGLFETLLGLLLIIPATRSIGAVGLNGLLVILYWANFNMWYNDIPLNGTQYDDVWHVIRLIIQIFLILLISWIGEITPFKGKEKSIESMDVFQGRISSCSFESGDRIVVGDWMSSPFGRFTDIMWAKPDGHRVLIAPNSTIAEYVEELYTFDEIQIQDIDIENEERTLSLKSEGLALDFEWNKGWRIPFRRSLFFIATVELFFARVFFGTRTHGTTKNNRKEWYAIDHVSKIIKGSATIHGQDVGDISSMTNPCKFGFSEAPKQPSSCEVRTHIQ